MNETKEGNIVGRRNDGFLQKVAESVNNICVLMIMQTLLTKNWGIIMLGGGEERVG